MDITVSEDVYARAAEVKEWLESRSDREATWDEVLLALLDQFQMVPYPEDLGTG